MALMGKKITHLVMMGDSLSDRGTMNHRKLWGILPMNWLSGLYNRSPKGRFTNGYNWCDDIGAILASQFIINEAERHKEKKPSHLIDPTDLSDAIFSNDLHAKPYIDHFFHNRPYPQSHFVSPTDIADDIVNHRNHFIHLVENRYALDQDSFVKYGGKDFIRNYDEGGLTAHDYSWTLSTSISRFFSRFILSTLSTQRKKLLADDKKNNLSKEHKANTLIIEWSGANDLITVNKEPSKAETDQAINDRIKNVEILIKSGYRHFVLFDLPDLSLTPRYQNEKDKEQRKNAQGCCLYFNKELQKACKTLQQKYPLCSIGVFEVGKQFTAMYEHPRQYYLDPKKLKTSYINSEEFKANQHNPSYQTQHVSPARQYMFWDDVHPTADVHECLANLFYKQYRRQYNFSPPTKEGVILRPGHRPTAQHLYEIFKEKYQEKFKQDQGKFFGITGLFRRSRLPLNLNCSTDPEEALQIILKHALYDGGDRTREVITELKWIQNGRLNLEYFRYAKPVPKLTSFG